VNGAPKLAVTAAPALGNGPSDRALATLRAETSSRRVAAAIPDAAIDMTELMRPS